MKLTAFFNTVNDSNASNTLGLFNNQPKDKTKISEGMSPNEIANIISDRLIEEVKKKFQIAKEEYQKSQNKLTSE